MIIIVTTVACFTCGAIGYFVGWITTADRLDRREEAAAEAIVGPIRPSTFPAQEAEDFWANVKLDVGAHARSSPRVTAGGFPALPAGRGAIRIGNMTDPVTLAVFADYLPPPPEQPPLRELVQPGRTTDFIAKVKADTDRWMAARGLEDAS